MNKHSNAVKRIVRLRWSGVTKLVVTMESLPVKYATSSKQQAINATYYLS
ncbi:MAG: hypothetical protein ACK4WF_02795 [Candidatus Brocadiales bacterium]